jgi:hypothetical protein
MATRISVVIWYMMSKMMAVTKVDLWLAADCHIKIVFILGSVITWHPIDNLHLPVQ